MGTVLVTGASGGIGEELARRAARDGHELVLVARRVDRLEALRSELGADRCRVVAADLGTREGLATVTAAVTDVDVLVNNAGYGDFGAFADADPARTQGMIDLNVSALTALTQAYLPGMLARGHGRILNVASTAAFFPGPLMAVYYATKAYVLSFTEAVATEVRGTGVTATALCPGPTESGFQSAAEMESSRLVRGRRLPSSRAVAEYGWDAMERGTVVAVHGWRNRAQVLLERVTPRAVIRSAVLRAQRPT